MVAAPPSFAGRPGPLAAAFVPAYAGALLADHALRAGSGGVPVLAAASGVLIAALILAPYRLWPLVLACGWLAAAAVRLGATAPGTPFPAQAVEALCGAALLRRFVPDALDVERASQRIGYALLALAAGVAAGAGLAAWAGTLLAPGASLGARFAELFLADGTGALVVTPAILAWSVGGGPERPARAYEIALLAASLLATSLYVFRAAPAALPAAIDPPYLVVPFLLWMATRCGTRAATAGVLAVALIAAWNAARGRGPFSAAGPTPRDHALALQAFLAVTALPTLVLAVALAARRRAEERRRAAEEELHRAQKLELVGRLAGGVAHDFNNYLTVILGHAGELLPKVRDDERARVSIERIVQAARRSAALTRQLLAFSRRQVVRPEVIDPNAAVAEFAPLLRGLIGTHVALQIVPGADVPHVYIDPRQLEQVLMNLVLNARDALPEGGTITLRTERAPVGDPGAGVPPGEYARIQVCDDGVGIDPALQERIFEPFFTTKSARGGTGLGLATVQGIVHQNRGAIAVRSQPGAGATFDVLLPACAAPAAAAAPAANREREERPATVLVADGDDLVRELARETLESRGHRVIAAADGNEALARARAEGPIDLVIADLHMPPPGGAALARALAGRRAGPRVLYTSAYADEPDGGANGVELLQKPFTREELLALVRRTLAPEPAAALPSALSVEEQAGGAPPGVP